MNSKTKPQKIIVIGAGVIGLTTALTIKQTFPNLDVLIISKHLPADNETIYTSPKAGAQWYSDPNQNEQGKKRHILGYKMFKKLSKDHETWVKAYVCYIGSVGTPEDEPLHPYKEPWFSKVVDNFEYVGKDETKFPGVFNICKYTSFSISTQFYLQYLMTQNVKKGVRVERRSIESLTDAYLKVPFYENSPDSRADLVINCTGIQFNMLEDCHDPELRPIRGHTIFLENSMPYQVTFDIIHPTEDGEFLMQFPRKEGGSAIGGIYDAHSPEWDESIHQDYVDRLLERTKKHLPELTKYGKEELKIVKHNLGFRPHRDAGPRVEADSIDGKIVHNYGCGSLGYIESWGCAADIVEILKRKYNLKKRGIFKL